MANAAIHTAPAYWLRTLGLISAAVFAREDADLEAERVAWLISEIDDFTRRAGARARTIMLLSTLAVAILAPLMLSSVKSLARMTRRERVRALERLEASRFSAPLIAVKALLSIVYYEHPNAQRDVGFDTNCLVPHS